MNSKNIKQNLMNTVIPSIVIAIVTALVTTLCNSLVWNIQYKKQNEDKILEVRIRLMEDVAENVMKYQQLATHRLEYSLAIKYYTDGVSLTGYEEKAKVEEKVQKLMPSTYQKVLESEELLPILNSKLILAQIYFGDKTKEAIKNFNDNVISSETGDFVDLYVQKLLDEGKEFQDIFKEHPQGGYTVNFKRNEFIDKAIDVMHTYTLGVLDAMKEDLKLE